jgi:hypothetical protein
MPNTLCYGVCVTLQKHLNMEKEINILMWRRNVNHKWKSQNFYFKCWDTEEEIKRLK